MHTSKHIQIITRYYQNPKFRVLTETDLQTRGKQRLSEIGVKQQQQRKRPIKSPQGIHRSPARQAPSSEEIKNTKRTDKDAKG